eukprot:827913-Ditylum_brightwellii.AAC.1
MLPSPPDTHHRAVLPFVMHVQDFFIFQYQTACAAAANLIDQTCPWVLLRHHLSALNMNSVICASSCSYQ